MRQTIIRDGAVLGDRRSPDDASRFGFEFIRDAFVRLQGKGIGFLTGVRGAAFGTVVEMHKAQRMRSGTHPQGPDGLTRVDGLIVDGDELHSARKVQNGIGLGGWRCVNLYGCGGAAREPCKAEAE